MPILRSWHVAHPRDWSPDQREMFSEDVCLNVALAMAHALPMIGPMTGVTLLLAVVRNIAAAHPAIADKTMDALLDLAADIAKTAVPEEGRVVN